MNETIKEWIDKAEANFRSNSDDSSCLPRQRRARQVIATSSWRVFSQFVLVVAPVLVMSACDRESRNTQESVAREQHPHTTAMLKTIQVMERRGYHPASSENRQKSFADDPVAWLGPWHIAAPNNDRVRTEWRLAIYKRGSDPQPHSFLSVEQNLRVNESLFARLRDEWERIAPVALPNNVVMSGEQLVKEAAERFARRPSDQAKSVHSYNSPKTVSGPYELRIEVHDTPGFSDSEGTVSDFGRAILYFTRVNDD